MLRTWLAGLTGAVCLTFGFTACSAPPAEEEGDSGLDGQALTSASSGGCDRGTIQQAAIGDRRTILDRGFSWLDAHVPYNQSQQYQSYRTDCSGFVSMAWQLGHSETTASLIGYAQLPHVTDLQPGDALVHRSGSSGHAILFAGWKDSSKTSACILQEAGTGIGTTFGAWTVSYLNANGYKPIRKPGLSSTSTADAPGPATSGTTAGATAGTCNRNGAFYCGNPATNLKGDPSTLYHCESGRMVLSQACTNGCNISSQGTDDFCIDDPNGTTTTSGGIDTGTPSTTCGSEGSGCIVDANCCQGVCISGQCRSGSGGDNFCQSAGAVCGLDSDCCSNSCFDSVCD